MKRVVLTLALLSTMMVGALAQSSNCYDEYYTLFRQRGSKPITDGDQVLVVAIKKDNVSRCFMGKVMVKNGEMVPPVYIEKADGSFEAFKPELSPAYANVKPEMRRSIDEGMTITFITAENESVKGFFIKFLNDKPKANKAAPSAQSY